MRNNKDNAVTKSSFACSSISISLETVIIRKIIGLTKSNQIGKLYIIIKKLLPIALKKSINLPDVSKKNNNINGNIKLKIAPKPLIKRLIGKDVSACPKKNTPATIPAIIKASQDLISVKLDKKIYTKENSKNNNTDVTGPRNKKKKGR